MDLSSITSWLLSMSSWVVGIIFLLIILLSLYYLMNWIEGISSRDEIRALRQDIKKEFENLKSEMSSDVGFLDQRQYDLGKSKIESDQIRENLRKNGTKFEYKYVVKSDQGLFNLLSDMNTIRTTQLDEHLANVTDQIKTTNDKLDRIIEELQKRK